jgi:protocatechuate 3,4-dioxygenase beta subunit
MRTALYSTFIVSMLTLTACSQNPTKTTVSNTDSQTTPTPTSIVASSGNKEMSKSKNVCGITKEVTEGPYYVSGTSKLIDGNLNYTNLPGDKIKITGYVYSGEENTTPLPNSKIEIWQADTSGSYHPESNGAATKYNASQIALRGYVETDNNGYYEFMTIYPGEYEGRARHIHIKATSNNKSVVTQLIMSKSGDKFPASNDQIAQSLPVCNTMALRDDNGIQTAEFDFHLM